MSISTGGILGRNRGKVGNVVFGAARGKVGKIVTAREYVRPANPQTADQQNQRQIFLEALWATRYLTSSMWGDMFNRAIGQLPGFQSMMSIILNATSDTQIFEVPPDTPLGNLHLPDTTSFNTGAGASGSLDLTWSDELGLNGTDADEIYTCVIKREPEANYKRLAVYQGTSVTRVDAALTISSLEADEYYTIGLWLAGAGTADGLLSPVRWYQQKTKA